ncbi:hypothetical protein [Streptomyces yaizuensis]|uniref:XRE family transcriptional regulator n=1 Tax=Streptomyces yaizuensis TaxID=2989713 RepID=A0ABQ5P6C2_9ACTN|nr:hypothetical protein [Streptomyces sp. YSPA8]GLF98146.1 hypothetical protein SYYSPA8_27635 [Streptomyces sp. YSPA8]
MVRTTVFAVLLEQRGLTAYEAFRHAFREAAVQAAGAEREPRLARVMVSRATFDRWSAGRLKGVPRREAATILRHLFAMPAEHLFEDADTEDADTGTPAPDGGEVEFDGAQEIGAQTRLLTASNADPALVATVRTSLEGVIDRYEALGPRLLVGETRLLRTMLHTLLAGHQPPRARAELFHLAARTAGVLGYMAVNSSAPFATVDAYCTEAELLAREAGDRETQMWAAGTRSLGLYYTGRYTEADQAARAGVDLAPDSPQAIRLLVNGRARALARTGERRGAEAAIGRAMTLSERQTTLSEGMTSCIAFTPYSLARTLANAITARLALGDTQAVLDHAAEIDPLLNRSSSRWSRALVGLDVATALLHQPSPEIDHAMVLGRTALTAGATAPIRSVWQRAGELHQHAARWHTTPAVRDYADMLRSWRSQPQAAPQAAPAAHRL